MTSGLSRMAKRSFSRSQWLSTASCTAGLLCPGAHTTATSSTSSSAMTPGRRRSAPGPRSGRVERADEPAIGLARIVEIAVLGGDVHHEAARAAVEEKAVHRVRQILAVAELAEGASVLAPVGDERGLVARSL